MAHQADIFAQKLRPWRRKGLKLTMRMQQRHLTALLECAGILD